VWEGEALVFKRGAKRKKMESQIVTKDTRIFELEDEVSRLSYLWKSEVNAYTELEAEVERLKDEIVDMLHKERHERNKEDTMADEKNYYCTLERMFQEHMDELQEDSTELDHGFMCGVAAERTIEDISAHVEAISEKHKWGHIEAVNKAFYGG
jgi:chromosome segregation ATPase